MVITSKANPLIKKISSLYDKKYRRLYGLYIVDGIKPVAECIAAGCEVETIICSESFLKRFGNVYIDASIVSDSVFSSISDEKTPQGVMALVKIQQNKMVKPTFNCLLLDGLQDPGNMGTIIRTANAAGYKEIYLIDCVDPYSPKSVRASMSGVFFTKIYTGNKQDVLSALQGVPLISADMDGEDIFQFTPPEKFCLCIGNEGNGISEEVKNLSSYTVKIPMEKTCESLNAGVSAGIAMYVIKSKQLNLK
ncbi:MAG: RNA methyltransferase [Clostridiales bacterium]|nr:RNA methyltransferase [Clostridiales bacterium]